MSDNIKTIVTLFLITLISGLLLGAVYGITKEPIALANAETTQGAYAELLPGADSYIDRTDDLELSEELSSDTENTIDGIVEGRDSDGNLIGYVVTVSSHEGYSGDIQLTVGYNCEDGELVTTGISFLSISETAGLGMNADTDDFKARYAGKSVDTEFTVTKTGEEGDGMIDAISGATVTSNAVTGAVNAANLCVKEFAQAQ